MYPLYAKLVESCLELLVVLQELVLLTSHEVDLAFGVRVSTAGRKHPQGSNTCNTLCNATTFGK
jgi:hypothetical protein